MTDSSKCSEVHVIFVSTFGKARELLVASATLMENYEYMQQVISIIVLF